MDDGGKTVNDDSNGPPDAQTTPQPAASEAPKTEVSDAPKTGDEGG